MEIACGLRRCRRKANLVRCEGNHAMRDMTVAQLRMTRARSGVVPSGRSWRVLIFTPASVDV